MERQPKIRVGTRSSALARWQAEWVASRLTRLGCMVDLIQISTAGDVQREGPIGAIGSQGVFTKELQRALLDDRVDVAVHSLKDMPTDTVAGLVLASVPTRESPHDALVAQGGQQLDELPPGARIGTGSQRRRAQLLHYRNDLHIEPIRGNVDTRLRKLDEGQYDAIMLAEAGLLRLGLGDRVSQLLPFEVMLPAVGQGALGIEARVADETTRRLVAQFDDRSTRAAVFAERAMLASLRGGCSAPIGGWARVVDRRLQLDGVVLTGDGSQRISASGSGELADAEQIGRDVAAQLDDMGSDELIAATG